MTEAPVIIDGLSDLWQEMLDGMVRNHPRRSAYERGLLLELRIARVGAWAQYLAMVGLAIGKVVRPNIMSRRQLWLVQALTLISATLTAGCEYRAERDLRVIWETELAVRINATNKSES